MIHCYIQQIKPTYYLYIFYAILYFCFDFIFELILLQSYSFSLEDKKKYSENPVKIMKHVDI